MSDNKAFVRLLCVLFVLAMVTVRDSCGDVLITKSGSEWEGEVTEQDGKYILVRPGGGKMIFFKSNVKEVIEKELSPPTQDEPPPPPPEVPQTDGSPEETAIDGPPDQETPPPAEPREEVDPEVKKWRDRFTKQDESRLVRAENELERLTEKRKKMLANPKDTGWHPVGGRTMGQMFGSDPKSLRKEALRRLAEEIEESQKMVDDLKKSIAALKTASLADMGERIRKAEEWDAKMAKLRAKYDTPEKAADFVVLELLANRGIRSARRRGITQAGRMTRGTLFSSAGIIADPETARQEERFARVPYLFEFITRAGFVRQNVGEVLVGEIDGIWRAFVFDVDGVRGSEYPFAFQKYLLALEEEELKEEEASEE